MIVSKVSSWHGEIPTCTLDSSSTHDSYAPSMPRFTVEFDSAYGYEFTHWKDVTLAQSTRVSRYKKTKILEFASVLSPDTNQHNNTLRGFIPISYPYPYPTLQSAYRDLTPITFVFILFYHWGRHCQISCTIAAGNLLKWPVKYRN